MKNRQYILLVISIIIFSCKNTEKKEETTNKYSVNTIDKILKTTINDTLTVSDKNIIVFIDPNETEIAELKKKHGEDNFYIIADDVAGYLANTTEQLDLKKIKYITTDKKVIHFKNTNIYVNKEQLENKWSISYFDKNNKIKNIAPIDFDLNDVAVRYSNINYEKWYGKYDYSIDYGKIDELSGAVVGYNVSIKKDSVTFSGGGYQTDFYYLCNLETELDTLVFKYTKTIEGSEYNNSKKSPLLKLYFKNGNYYIKSKLIYSIVGKEEINDVYVKVVKR